MILYHGFSMIIWPPAFAAPNALRAVSDVTFTMLVSVGSMWAFRIGLAYVFVKFFDLPVLFVWVAMSFDWIFRFILFIWRFKSGKWMQFHMANNR